MESQKVIILMADYGHDPTETAVPYSTFKTAGWDVQFATENGQTPNCDKKMLTGLTQKLLGANCQSVQLYKSMTEDPNFQKPHAWTEPNFSLDVYDVVFLPGGHDKGVRQVIDSPVVHKLLAAYFPQTKKPSRKTVVAVCHGVMALARARNSDGNSVLHDVHTTALPGFMEQSIFWATRAFLGDYYKTYGAGSESVEQDVKSHLGNPKIQYHNSLSMGPFIHEDENYNYISGRFPPDAQLLAEKTIALVQRNALL